MQGASVALGRYASGRLAAAKAFHDKLAKARDAAAFARARGLLLQGATRAEQSPGDSRALETLQLIHTMQREELAILGKLGEDDAMRERSGISVGELKAMQRVANNSAKELGNARLEELVLRALGSTRSFPANTGRARRRRSSERSRWRNARTRSRPRGIRTPGAGTSTSMVGATSSKNVSTRSLQRRRGSRSQLRVRLPSRLAPRWSQAPTSEARAANRGRRCSSRHRWPRSRRC